MLLSLLGSDPTRPSRCPDRDTDPATRIVQDASLADRILHHGEVFYLKGPSFRLKGRSLDSELVAAAAASTNGTDAELEAQHRIDGPEDTVRWAHLKWVFL